ncbi:DUF3954 domain-containing protein [Salibacterium halotolerans]|uniref:DUF3954 domain-containing protein n=1 Tax=Salibacterium halotolerans TaxID=1884432 RepID=A0A1I5MLT5_9BACI|nr:DUF3954 domain-containing protein [Salibacterium halotolerans]SFP10509.1 Protein of unknown function [Salibacterium halotolerans]
MGDFDLKQEISLKEDAAYVVKNGKLTTMKAPECGHGNDEIVWKDGKVLDVIRSKRERINGQEYI